MADVGTREAGRWSQPVFGRPYDRRHAGAGDRRHAGAGDRRHGIGATSREAAIDTELAPGQQVANYRIESFLARGGMAVVYRERHVRLGRRVALKLLAPELAGNESFQRRFIRESQLAAAIEHPNIIPIYEAGKLDELLYIAMRYVEGLDLGELLEREGPLNVDRAILLFQQAASALDAAHARNLVHRDVKPGNILVAPQGRADGSDHVYLTDFGLTKRADSLSGLTGTGHFIGTLDYIAPEQISGGPVDGRADVYALGCVLFRALTGALPFERDRDVAVMYAHLSQPPPAVTSLRPDLSRNVDEVLAKAMAKSPNDRYAGCCELVSDLRAATEVARPAARPSDRPAAAPVSEVTPAPESPQTPTPDIGRPRRGLRRAIAAVALLAVTAAGGALVAWRAGYGAAKEPAAVVLPFAVETYPDSGLRVSRTWTLSGRSGDHLQGELRVVATRATAATLYELLPGALSQQALSNVTFTPKPDEVRQPDSAVGYRIAGARGGSWTFTYAAPVTRGELTLGRLQQWAREESRDAEAFRRAQGLTQPSVIASLQLAPTVMQLQAGGAPHLLLVSGYYPGGRAAPADVVAGARYVVDRPRVVGVGQDGRVTPREVGSATVTVALGPLSAAARVVVLEGTSRAITGAHDPWTHALQANNRGSRADLQEHQPGA